MCYMCFMNQIVCDADDGRSLIVVNGLQSWVWDTVRWL